MTYITILPRCIHCGSAIGHKYPIFYRIIDMRREQYIAKTGYDIRDYADLIEVEVNDILDDCAIKSLCCRTAFLTHLRITNTF